MRGKTRKVQESEGNTAVYINVRQNVRHECKTNVRKEKLINTDVLQDKNNVIQGDVRQNGCILNTIFTIRLEEDLKKEIQRQADELNISVSALIRSVLQNYFK